MVTGALGGVPRTIGRPRRDTSPIIPGQNRVVVPGSNFNEPVSPAFAGVVPYMQSTHPGLQLASAGGEPDYGSMSTQELIAEGRQYEGRFNEMPPGLITALEAARDNARSGRTSPPPGPDPRSATTQSRTQQPPPDLDAQRGGLPPASEGEPLARPPMASPQSAEPQRQPREHFSVGSAIGERAGPLVTDIIDTLRTPIPVEGGEESAGTTSGYDLISPQARRDRYQRSREVAGDETGSPEAGAGEQSMSERIGALSGGLITRPLGRPDASGGRRTDLEDMRGPAASERESLPTVTNYRPGEASGALEPEPATLPGQEGQASEDQVGGLGARTAGGPAGGAGGLASQVPSPFQAATGRQPERDPERFDFDSIVKEYEDGVAEINKMDIEPDEKERRRALSQSLLVAGLSMMAAASQPGATALGALGEGGLQGVGQYEAMMEQARDRNRERRSEAREDLRATTQLRGDAMDRRYRQSRDEIGDQQWNMKFQADQAFRNAQLGLQRARLAAAQAGEQPDPIQGARDMLGMMRDAQSYAHNVATSTSGVNIDSENWVSASDDDREEYKSAYTDTMSGLLRAFGDFPIPDQLRDRMGEQDMMISTITSDLRRMGVSEDEAADMIVDMLEAAEEGTPGGGR